MGAITDAYFNNGVTIAVPKYESASSPYQAGDYKYTADNADLTSIDHYAYDLSNA